jgi:hypothetical protein
MFKWFSRGNQPSAEILSAQNTQEQAILQREGIKKSLENIESFAFQKESSSLHSLEDVQKLLETCFKVFPAETLATVQKLLTQEFDIRQDVYVEILLSPSVQREILQKNSGEVVNKHLQGNFQKNGSFRPNPVSPAERLAATHFLQEESQPREQILERALKNPEEALLQLASFEESVQDELIALLSYRNPEIVSQIIQAQIINIGKQLPADTVKKILLGFLHIQKEQKLLFLGRKESSLTRPEILAVFKEVNELFHQDIAKQIPETKQPVKKREFHENKYISATEILRQKTLTKEDVSLSAILDFTETLHNYPRYANEPWAGEILSQVIIRDEHAFVVFFEALCKSQSSYNPTLLNPLIAEGVRIFPDSLLVWADFQLEELPEKYKLTVQAAVREATRVETLKNGGKPLEDKKSLHQTPKNESWAKIVCSRPEYFTDEEMAEALAHGPNSREALAFIDEWYRSPIGKKILEQAIEKRKGLGNQNVTFEFLFGHAVLRHIKEHSVQEIADACLATKTQPDAIFSHPQAKEILKKLNLLTPEIISTKMLECPVEKEVLKAVFSFEKIVGMLAEDTMTKNYPSLESAFFDLFTSEKQARFILNKEVYLVNRGYFSKLIKITLEKYPALANRDVLQRHYQNIDESFLTLLLKNESSVDVAQHLSKLISKLDNVYGFRTNQENESEMITTFKLILNHPDSLKILKVFKENNIQIPHFVIRNFLDAFSPELLSSFFSLDQLCELARQSKKVEKNIKEALSQKMTESEGNVLQLLILLPKQDFEKYCGNFVEAFTQRIDSLPKDFFQRNFSFREILQLFLKHPKIPFLVEACKSFTLDKENFLLIWNNPDKVDILKSLGLYTKVILPLCPGTISEEILSDLLSPEELARELWQKSYSQLQTRVQSIFVRSIENKNLTDEQIAELCEQTLQKHLTAFNDSPLKTRELEQQITLGLKNLIDGILALAKTREDKTLYQNIIWKISILSGTDQVQVKAQNKAETASPLLHPVNKEWALKELGTDSKAMILQNLTGCPTHLIVETFSPEELKDLQKQYPEANNIRRAYEKVSKNENALAEDWLENPYEQNFRKLITKKYEGRMHELVPVFQKHLKEVVLARSEPRHDQKGLYYISPEVTADHTDLKVLLQIIKASFRNSPEQEIPVQNILKQLSEVVAEAQTHLCAEDCNQCTPYEQSLREALATRFTTYQTMCKSR